ncbi:uncharacterized protein TrAtP1_008843 [Trichoderma atroviride]|uniref:uncharacterized protein n=1 Tax=Hypocrea atroviridis TaxID=63577 RepID=UPI00331E78FF|nr:hypothetical protein TrAtP1_008843 [Trichoderma atroviride]
MRTRQMLANEAIQAQHGARGTALDKVWQGLWTDTVPSGQRGERSGRGGPLERSNGQPRRALAKPPIGGTPNGLRSRSSLSRFLMDEQARWRCGHLSAHSSPHAACTRPQCAEPLAPTLQPVSASARKRLEDLF